MLSVCKYAKTIIEPIRNGLSGQVNQTVVTVQLIVLPINLFQSEAVTSSLFFLNIY